MTTTVLMPMTKIPPYERRQLPQNTVQAAAQLSGDVVSGLGRSPLMLGVVVLNIIGIVAAVYFLNMLIRGQQQHLQNLLAMQQAQIEKLSTVNNEQMSQLRAVHNREFDAMMEMMKSTQQHFISGATTPPPPPPLTPPRTPPR